MRKAFWSEVRHLASCFQEDGGGRYFKQTLIAVSHCQRFERPRRVLQKGAEGIIVSPIVKDRVLTGKFEVLRHQSEVEHLCRTDVTQDDRANFAQKLLKRKRLLCRLVILGFRPRRLFSSQTLLQSMKPFLRASANLD